MPSEGIEMLSYDDVLRYEEIIMVARAAANLGINKVRITGGEPLVRANLASLVHMLAGVEGIDDIALTTNGILLGQYAFTLKQAGLKRVNISLDTLRRERFKQITRRDNLSHVLDGMKSAQEAGLEPVKLNMVVMRGINDGEVVDFARMTITDGWHVRFIEHMPFAGRESISFVPTSEIRDRLNSIGKLESCMPSSGSGPAKYFKFKGAPGTVGFISPLSEHFCFSCNRLRLTVDGKLRPCLFSDEEVDLRATLKGEASVDKDIEHLIKQAVDAKPLCHRLNEGISPDGLKMSQVGG
jgi:cyclic pyranopterin phosphate synthase